MNERASPYCPVEEPLTDGEIEDISLQIGQPGDIAGLFAAIRPVRPAVPSTETTTENTMAQQIQSLAEHGPLSTNQVNTTLANIHQMPISWFWRMHLLRLLATNAPPELKGIVEEHADKARKESNREVSAQKAERKREHRGEMREQFQARAGNLMRGWLGRQKEKESSR